MVYYATTDYMRIDTIFSLTNKKPLLTINHLQAPTQHLWNVEKARGITSIQMIYSPLVKTSRIK